jgi:hypothetical protein
MDDNERLGRIETVLSQLYEWTQNLDKGIREAQSAGGMSGMMMRAMVPPGTPVLPKMPPLLPSVRHVDSH